jgi:signal transduction histidine kinase
MAVMAVTVVLTLCLLAFFFRTWWNPGVRESTRINLRQYAELLTKEIGTPPDHDKATRLSDTLKLGIAIRNPNGSWWFSPRVPETVRTRILEREQGLAPPYPGNKRLGTRLPEGPSPHPQPPESAYVHWRKGRMLAVIPASNGYTFVYGSRRKQPWEGSPLEWLLLFGGMAGLWFLAWLFLRRQLQPVRDLARGVRAVETGNLDARISETGSNELADLAVSFNNMTRSLKERLRARDQLMLDVSHELRSPLTRMRVALEMAEPGVAVDSLHEEVDALGKMVSEILETERLNSNAGSLNRVPTSLGELLEEKVARFEGQLPGVVLREDPVPEVSLDPERMRLVFRNLIENALKHGRESLNPVVVTLRREGDLAVIAITNGGATVPEEEQRLIFEPFYRTDRSRSGTPGYGLGLPLCKRIVEAHGGTISFRSRAGEGTTVTLKIPLY